MISRLVFLLFCGNIALNLGNAQKLPRVKRQSLRVQINATGDAVCMRYIRPSPSTKLEGFILGYGSSSFSNQYISLPSDGKSYITEVDAEPRYLIAVRPAPAANYKKPCSGKTNKPKPLQLVIGTLTPTSAFLSWGILVNPKHDWTTMNNCANGRFYTVRYREKEKDKKWVLQLCPTTETVVDNLKPNTVYEFGVKDNTDNGIWSKNFNHKMAVSIGKIKENGQLQNNRVPQFIPGDSKVRIPITVIKQVLQNVTHLTQSKIADKSPLAGPIQVHVIIPESGIPQKLPPPLTLDISEKAKKTLAKNESQEWPSESKTAELQEISPQSQPAMTELEWESSKPTIPSISEETKSIPAPETKHHVPSPKTTISPHVVHTKPVLNIIALRTEPPKTEMEEKDPVPLRPKTQLDPDVPQTKPEEKDAVPSKPKTQLRPDAPQTKPEEKDLVPSSPKTRLSPDVPQTKPEEKDPVPSKPKTRVRPDLPQTKPVMEAVTFRTEQPKSTIAPKETHRGSARPKTSPSPGITSTKPSPKGSRRDPSKPKTSPSPKVPKTKPAPKGTRFVPSKPKTSGKPEVPQTKPAPTATYLGSINLHIHVLNDPKDTLASFKPHSSVTTESPHLKTAPHKVYHTTAKPKTTDKSQARPVVIKTTPTPGRTRMPGGLTGGKVSRVDKLTDQDATRVLSTSSSTSSNPSMDSTMARKKPEPVATPPDSPRPPLAPAKPTPMRRKPLPPNTVTGKPGRPGNVVMPRAPFISPTSSAAKPTGPTSLAKTSSPKKPPTAASSPDYSNPMFSSLPTTETDVAGTPRYTGDHVKYIKKGEDVPCSITDTLQHFPTEEGEGLDRATSPPQKPPTNLTVVTVEGCPSFVIIDWEKPQNETVTEYKVVSTENGGPVGKDKSIITTNQTHSTVENLKPNTSYEFVVIPSNPLGEGPSSDSKPFKTESADPRVTEPIPMGKDAIWTEIKFNSDTYSECKGRQYVKRTWYKKFVGVQLCNSLRYKIYLSDSLTGTFYNIGDQRGHGEDHCQFVDSYLDGKTGQQLPSDQLPSKDGFFRAVRQEPVSFGKIGAETHTNYVHWYECGTSIPGKW